jgi:hypothetical protein
MWGTKDLALVALLAALSALTAASIGQMGYMLTGLRGVNSVFTILMAIQTGFALLIYQGRRWRFFVQMTIFTVLIAPTYYGGAPFDVLMKSSFIMAAFVTDITASSLYNLFKSKNRQKYYAILHGGVLFFTLQVLLSMVMAILFYTTQAAGGIFILTLLSPIIIVGSIAGSYIGYKMYRRISNEKE